MPFNPVVSSTNDGLARGIAQGAAALAQGIQGYYQKQEEKKLQEQATSTFQKYLGSNPGIAQSIGLQDPTDTKAIGAAIKALGGPAKALEFGANAMQMQQMQQKQAEEAALKARMDSMLRMSQNPQGPLSNANAAMMQDPAMGAALKAYGMSGSPRQATELYGEMMKQQAANAGRERAPANVVDLKSYRSAGPDGKPIEVTVDQRTGRSVGQGPVNEPKYFADPSQAGAITSAQKEAENAAKMNYDYITETVNAAKDSKGILAQNQKIVDLYKNGAESGFGQEFLSKLGSLGVSMGFVKKGDQSTQEQLKTALAAGQLATAREFLKGQGSVTESERARVDAAGANFDNQDLANLNIVGTGMAVANHRIAKERVRQQLYDKGLRGGDLAENLRRWDTENDFQQFFPQEVTQLMDQVSRQQKIKANGNPIKGAPR